MFTRLVRFGLSAILLGVTLAAPAAERGYRQIVDGVAIYFGIMPAQLVRGHPPDHPEGQIHGGAAAALNYRRNVVGTDVTLLAGDFRGDRVVGLDLAGRLGDAGLYAEAAHTRPALGAEYTRATLGAEYAFPNTLTVGAEYYYNGQGTRDRARYDFASLFAGKALNVARRYVGAHLKYELTPLLRSENYLIGNLDDGSRFFAPSLVYSVTANWDWAVGAQFFAGGADSEYGRFHDLYYTYVQWFF